MVAPEVQGIDLFKIANRSISGWVPSFKMGSAAPVKLPFCSQLEERLLVQVSQLTSVFATTHQQHNYPKIANLFRKSTPARSPHPRGKSKGRSMGTKVKKAERFAAIRKTPKSPQIVPL